MAHIFIIYIIIYIYNCIYTGQIGASLPVPFLCFTLWSQLSSAHLSFIFQGEVTWSLRRSAPDRRLHQLTIIPAFLAKFATSNDPKRQSFEMPWFLRDAVFFRLCKSQILIILSTLMPIRSNNCRPVSRGTTLLANEHCFAGNLLTNHGLLMWGMCRPFWNWWKQAGDMLDTYCLLLLLLPSSTAQGGGGSFKNRKPIGELGCCESGMAERSHWWTERCLISLTLSISLSLTIYLPTYLFSMYLSIYRSS